MLFLLTGLSFWRINYFYIFVEIKVCWRQSQVFRASRFSGLASCITQTMEFCLVILTLSLKICGSKCSCCVWTQPIMVERSFVINEYNKIYSLQSSLTVPWENSDMVAYFDFFGVTLGLAECTVRSKQQDGSFLTWKNISFVQDLPLQSLLLLLNLFSGSNLALQFNGVYQEVGSSVKIFHWISVTLLEQTSCR